MRGVWGGKLRWSRIAGVARVLAGLLVAAFLIVAPGAGATPRALDPSFSSDGVVTLHFPQGAYVGGVVTDSRGRIVVAASPRVQSDDFVTRGLVTRLLPNGSLDRSFAANGRLYLPGFGTTSDIGIDSKGRIVVLSTLRTSPSPTSPGAMSTVVRITSGGALDPSFGNGGFVTIDDSSIASPEGSPARQFAPELLAMEPNDEIVLAGNTGIQYSDGYDVDFGVMRLSANGGVDKSFGIGGLATADFGPYRIPSTPSASGPEDQDLVNDVSVAPDGRIVAVGTTVAYQEGFYRGPFRARWSVARFTSQGALDRSFGSGGLITTNFDSAGASGASGVAIYPDGRLLVAGTNAASRYARLVVARYRVDGSLDPTFGTGGTLTGQPPSGASGVALRTDGRVFVAGSSSLTDRAPFRLLFSRLRADGSLDPQFGRRGVSVIQKLDGRGPFTGSAMTLDSHGRAVVVAETRLYPAASEGPTNLTQLSVFRFRR